MQQLIGLRGFDAHDGFPARDQSLAHHVHCNLHRRLRGALATPRLQHVQASALDGEFHVLHVTVMALELARDLLELLVGLG